MIIPSSKAQSNILFLLYTFLIICSTQLCYPICSTCTPNNPLSCTNCDPGYVLYSNTCINGPLLPPPLTYLRPSPSNTFLQPQLTTISCSPLIFAQFQTFTHLFKFPSVHSFFVLKLLTAGSENSAIELTLQDNNGVQQYLKQYREVGPKLTCPNLPSINGVIPITLSLPNTVMKLLLILKCVSCKSVLVSDIQFTYGSCNPICNTCRGPLPSQCITCSNLYQSIINGVCQGCPNGFYSDPTVNACMPCPVQCINCEYVAGMRCTKCNAAVTTEANCDITHLLITDDRSKWTATSTTQPLISTCGIYTLIGGIPSGIGGATFTKTYTQLLVHTSLYIQLTVFLIDQSTAKNTITLTIDQQKQITQVDIPNNTTNECGNSDPQFVIVIRKSIPHTLPSATITISAQNDYFSIHTLSIVLNNSTNNTLCLKQNNQGCTFCKSNLVLVNQSCARCPNGFYFADNACTICRIECKICNATNCITCALPYTMNKNGVCTTDTLYLEQATAHFTQWVMYPRLQSQGNDRCGDNYILGSTIILYKSLSMSRVYEGLPPHKGAMLLLYFYQIDDYTNSVQFVFNGAISTYTVIVGYGSNICGNATTDAVSMVHLIDGKHDQSSLSVVIRTTAAVKIGLSHIQLHLLQCSMCAMTVGYRVDYKIVYSLTGAAGVEVRIVLDQRIKNISNTNNLFSFNTFEGNETLAKLSTTYVVLNNSVFDDRVLTYLIDPMRELKSTTITVQVDANRRTIAGGRQKIDSNPNNITVVRYIDTHNVGPQRSLSNLFRGVALFALYISLFSFIFAMSSAFDDFFILIQIIFVHIFIQYSQNPPSFRIPMQGLSVVQFLTFLPTSATTAIDDFLKSIIGFSVVPIPYSDYFMSILQGIYHIVFFQQLMLILSFILAIVKLTLNAETNYIVAYYKQYTNNVFDYTEKVMRYVYFTLAWSTFLQIISQINSPITWVSLILSSLQLVLYPLGSTFYLWRKSKTLTLSTFNANYSQSRVSAKQLYFYPLRYLYYLLVAGVILLLPSPIAILNVLIAIHFLRTVQFLYNDELFLHQPFKLNAVFSEKYQLVYKVTGVVESVLLMLLEILMLIMLAMRPSADVENGLGFACCAVAVALIVNGLTRAGWGFLRTSENCYEHKKNIAINTNKESKESKDKFHVLSPSRDQLNYYQKQN